jgi:hypothetical protein
MHFHILSHIVNFFAVHHWAGWLSLVGPAIFGAINQCYEDFTRFMLQAPTGITINSGDVLIFGKGTKAMVGVAQTAQSSTNPVYDDNSGFITVQVSGAVNLAVSGFTQKSPSAGAPINRGDAVYADGGTFDATSGITYGSAIDADSGGTFIGIAMDPVLAGATTTIRVILKNGLGS